MRRILGTMIAAAVLVALGVTGAVAADRIEKSLPLEPGGRLVLDSDAGSVTVRGTDRSGAQVVITSRGADLEEDYEFTFENEPGAVRIEGEKKGGLSWFSFGGGHSISYEIEVPRETTLEIGTGGGSVTVENMAAPADVQTSGGSITAKGIDANLVAKTSGGSIHLTDIRGDATVGTSGGRINAQAIEGRLEARTSGGSIAIDGVRGDLQAKTSGGSIKVREAGGRVEAKTSGGSIYVAFAPGNGQGGELKTSAGGIDILVDPSLGFDVDFSTSAGSVNLDVPGGVAGSVSRSEVTGTIGGGGAPLVARTSAGSIDLETR
jgi:hypothetical protein